MFINFPRHMKSSCGKAKMKTPASSYCLLNGQGKGLVHLRGKNANSHFGINKVFLLCTSYMKDVSKEMPSCLYIYSPARYWNETQNIELNVYFVSITHFTPVSLSLDIKPPALNDLF